MAIASIQEWLSDPNRTYHHGKMLYEQYGSDIVAKTIIATGHQGSVYHFSYLEKALRNVTEAPAGASFVIPDLSEFAKEEKTGITDDQFKSLPDDIKNLRAEAKRLHNRLKWLHARIPVTDSQSDRLKMALQLLDDHDANRKIMARVQAALDKKEVTAADQAPVAEDKLKAVEDLTISELIAESNNLPPNISKDKKKLKAAEQGSARYAALEAKIARRQLRLEQVKRRLAS